MFTTNKDHARKFNLFLYGSLQKIKSTLAADFGDLEMKFRKLPYDGRDLYIFWFVDDDGIKNYAA